MKNKKLNELEKNWKVLSNLCRNCSNYLKYDIEEIPCIETNCPVFYSKAYSHDLHKFHKVLFEKTL